MAHLFIIAGHGHGDSGAVGYGYTEAERVRALAQKLLDIGDCLLYTSPSPRDRTRSRMPSSA